MSYPPPPGASKAAHHSLPSRPPQSCLTGVFKSFGKNTLTVSAGPTAYGASPATYGAAPQTYGAATTTYGAAPTTYGPTYPAASSTYGPNLSTGTTANAPASRNTFLNPVNEYNAEMAQQIATWQSAYQPKDPNALSIGPTLPESNESNEKKKTVVREGGGKKWEDETLLEWDPSHLRLFVGNLAGETTDDSLLKAFSRWKSVQKGKVIRDKRTMKSKGYGFVSFSDADDFFQAAKEMNGKYIQSHPVVVRKATTEIKPTTLKDKNKGKWKNTKNYKNKNNKGSGGRGGGSSNGYEPVLGATGAGVAKPGSKTKNGLRILG